MKVNFDTPMTIYELSAIILAVIAIAIPFVQFAWKKWGIKAKLQFLPTGRVFLFFNQSGSYVRIDGVYEAQRKPVSVKKVSIKIIRQKDDRKLNLTWSSFISPVNQNMVGNYLQTTESAHPFRIEADSIASSFIEYSDFFDSFGKNFRTSTKELFNKIQQLQVNQFNYQNTVHQYKHLPEYARACDLLEKEFFWNIGKYMIELETEYNDTKVTQFYEFSVGESENTALKENIEEALLSPIKSAYGVRLEFHAPTVELHTKN